MQVVLSGPCLLHPSAYLLPGASGLVLFLRWGLSVQAHLEPGSFYDCAASASQVLGLQACVPNLDLLDYPNNLFRFLVLKGTSEEMDRTSVSL